MADQITSSLAQAKVLVMEGQKGADGKSPYIGANGNWFVWNGTAWADTGIPASLDDAQIAAAVEAYLEEHPVSVTEQTVAEWGFTKNTGDYSKPSGGIPKTDLASDVQTSLGKADTALQQHQSLAGYATEAWVGQQIANIPDELPSGGSAGDFLRRTSSGAAWQTVPSAESDSFGGAG
jgi:hypothetical protein